MLIKKAHGLQLLTYPGALMKIGWQGCKMEVYFETFLPPHKVLE